MNAIESDSRLQKARQALYLAEANLGVKNAQSNLELSFGAAAANSPRGRSGEAESLAQLYRDLAARAGNYGWIAFLGKLQVGWARCAQEGIDLGRVIYIPQVPASVYPRLCAILIEGFSAIVLPQKVLSASQQRTLQARARKYDCALFNFAIQPPVRMLRVG